jgi:hypothetical protein
MPPEIGNTSVFSQTDANNNTGTQPSWAEGQSPSSVNDAARALQGAITREWNWRSVTLTSGGSADTQTLTYATAPAAYYNGQRFAFIAGFTNTGATTLNVNSLGATAVKKMVGGVQTALSAGDITAGNFYEVAYNTSGSAFIITAFSLGGTAASESTAGIVELATTAEALTGTDTARAVTPAGLAAATIMQGKHTIWIPASAMLSATTSGPASAQFETSTNDINFKVLDFDATADEHANFNIAFPKNWNESTITFQVFWTTTATDTDGVAWGLQGIALSDNEASDTAWGTAVVVTDDAQGAAGEILVTAESSAVTIGGTPAAADICFLRIFRDVSDANDDMTEDARLIGVKIFYTINAATDA